jgi:hypothetical protein
MIAKGSATPDARRPEPRRVRLAAIRGVRLLTSDATRLMTSNVRRLLEQLELCGNPEEGSRISLEALAARLGRSERTVRRWIDIAEAEGLIVIRHRWILGERVRFLQTDFDRVREDRLPPRQLMLPLDEGGDERSSAARSGPPDVPSGDAADRPEAPDFVPSGNVTDGHSVTAPVTKCPRLLRGSDPRGLDPSPQAPVAAAEPIASRSLEAEWEEVRDLLEDRGMGMAAGAVSGCRRLRVEPWQVLAVVRFFDAQAGCWNVGALYRRLGFLRPGTPVPEANWQADLDAALACWPKPHHAPRGAKPSAAVSRAQTTSGDSDVGERAPRVSRDAQIAINRRQWAERLRKVRGTLGPWWDALSRAERLELVERFGGAFERSRLERGGKLDSADWQPGVVDIVERAAEALVGAP